MKCWAVPSSLFVPGRIMAPIHLTREKKALEERKARLEAELAAIPKKILSLEHEISNISSEYEPFKTCERTHS